MEVLIEQILIYGSVALLIAGILALYVFKQKKAAREVNEKIAFAQEEGLYEPVSLYPVIDPNRCIGSGACIRSCPEHDILGLKNGKATIINASQCIGHGACFRACPVEAISLWIGTEKRGVELPKLSPTFETSVKGIYIAGELGGMGLIKNAVEQGRQATENIVKTIQKNAQTDYDLIIVGAGPAGISATLTAKKAGLRALTLDQDTLGGTVYTYPRSKIIMTHPMDLPLYGKVRLYETSKDELLDLWNKVLTDNHLKIKEKSKVEEIRQVNGFFEVYTSGNEKFSAQTVLLALGRRGSPRKLDIEGELSEKVAYRLIEPERIKNKKVLIVGGGDSAVEAALMLANDNKVILSYRGDKFVRLKTKNNQLITNAVQLGLLEVKFGTNPVSIQEKKVILSDADSPATEEIENDLVYIFAGGELPTGFLKKTGIDLRTFHGEAMLKH